LVVESVEMKRLRVEVQIDLNEDQVSETLSRGYTEETILQTIESHVRSALGNPLFEGWHYIDGISVTSVGVS